MKNIVLSAVAVLAMNTYAVAGGDIAPIDEPMVSELAPVVSESGFYIGAAYGLMNLNIEGSVYIPSEGKFKTSSDADLKTVMLQAGYNLNKYFAFEARYWKAFGNVDYSVSVTGEGSKSGSEESDGEDVLALYVKPIYPVTEAFDVYALLGYASIGEDFLDEKGLTWGLGAAYSFTNHISVFVDYARLYNDTKVDNIYGADYDFEATLGSWNFGGTYKF